MRPEHVVAMFELVSSLMIALSMRRLWIDKMVRGVSPWPIGFFALWGYWNVYWYWYIDAMWAWSAGLCVVSINTLWAAQIVYYLHRERRIARSGS